MEQHADFFSAATAVGAVRELDVDAMRLLFRVECAGKAFVKLYLECVNHRKEMTAKGEAVVELPKRG